MSELVQRLQFMSSPESIMTSANNAMSTSSTMLNRLSTIYESTITRLS